MKDFKPIVKKKNSQGARRLGSTAAVDVKSRRGKTPAGGEVNVSWDPRNDEQWLVDEYRKG